MMDFRISNALDKTKVFLMPLSKIEGRLDPNTYHIDRLSAIQKLKDSGVSLKQLKFLVTPSKETVKEIESPETIYVGLENIEGNTGDYIPTNEKESISSALVFKKGDILFPKLRPYLNKIFYATFDGICSTEFHVFKSDELDNEYLSYFLRSNLVVRQTHKLMSGNTLPRVQTSDIYNLLIPVIDTKKQEEANKVINTARVKRKQKQKEANAHFDGIDKYLLKELGISVPIKDNSIEARIYTSSLNEITNHRFDPEYYGIYFKELENSISTSPYNLVELGDIVSLINSGKTPSKDSYSEIPTEYPIIKVGSYQGDFIDLSKCDFCQNIQSLKAQRFDIFILSSAHQSEYVGRHLKYLVSEPQTPTSYVGELICVRSNPELCAPNFLFSLLKTELFKTLINREKSGQTSHIYGKDIAKIKIPLPPLAIQIELGKETDRRRNEAQRLALEANVVLEEAMVKFEQMILKT